MNVANNYCIDKIISVFSSSNLSNNLKKTNSALNCFFACFNFSRILANTAWSAECEYYAVVFLIRFNIVFDSNESSCPKRRRAANAICLC